jgi:hypothetical protein
MAGGTIFIAPLQWGTACCLSALPGELNMGQMGFGTLISNSAYEHYFGETGQL